MTADIAPVDHFLDAVVQRDFVACSRCLADSVVFKALLPHAHHDVSNAREAAWLLTHWLDDAREIEVLERVVDDIVDRVRIRDRLRLRYDDGWHVWEQQCCCTTTGGRITAAELVGSGFLKED